MYAASASFIVWCVFVGLKTQKWGWGHSDFTPHNVAAILGWFEAGASFTYNMPLFCSTRCLTLFCVASTLLSFTRVVLSRPSQSPVDMKWFMTPEDAPGADCVNITFFFCFTLGKHNDNQLSPWRKSHPVTWAYIIHAPAGGTYKVYLAVETALDYGCGVAARDNCQLLRKPRKWSRCAMYTKRGLESRPIVALNWI